MNKTNKEYYFQAPRVPLASSIDGLLPVSALDKPLPVDIVIWDTMQTGHSVQLMLNGKLCGAVRSKTENEVPGDLIAMHLDEQHLLIEGPYTLAYRATNPENNTHEDSPQVNLLVDRTAPGATLLSPIMFAQINFGDRLQGTVPGYAGMQPGDTIHTTCNAEQGPTCAVSIEHLTERPARIYFDRAFLDSLNSELIQITYHVIDRAGNRSVESQAVTLTYQHQSNPN